MRPSSRTPRPGREGLAVRNPVPPRPREAALGLEEDLGKPAPSVAGADRPTLSAVVVHYKDLGHLAACLEVLRADPGIGEIVVVDNASDLQTVEELRAACLDVQLILSTSNLGFGGGANLGAERATGDLLVFLNPDTVPDPGCMTALAEHLAARGGVAGPVVRTGSGGDPKFGCTVDRMLLPRSMGYQGAPLYISGCCLATTRSCFDAVGGFDARYFLFVEDVEFCWQALRRGFAVDVVPGAGLRHTGGAVAAGGYRRRGRIETTSSRVLLRERNSWAAVLACAPVARLPEVLALSLVRSVVFSGFSASRGRLRDAARLWAGLAWNLAHLRGTLERRRYPGVTRADEQEAWGRIARQLFLWDLARRGERLTFVDHTRAET